MKRRAKIRDRNTKQLSEFIEKVVKDINMARGVENFNADLSTIVSYYCEIYNCNHLYDYIMKIIDDFDEYTRLDIYLDYD